MTLYQKYRPNDLSEIVGQDAAVKQLRGRIERRDAQAFLFSGPAGTGKTSLARIAAADLGCQPGAIQELPAAVYTGVQDMRGLIGNLGYRPFGSAPQRALILDECHRLSGQAWDSLLKILEEPPTDVYWFMCTTNVAKVPKTIITRCAHIQLKEINEKELGRLYDEVCDLEKIELPDDVADMVIREARGSARQMFENLSACLDVEDKKEAAKVLKVAIDTDATIELCRLLASGKANWTSAMTIVNKFGDDESPEGVRIVCMNYFGKALKGSKSERDAAFFLNLLEAFATPYNQAEGIAPLLLSVGRCIFPA